MFCPGSPGMKCACLLSWKEEQNGGGNAGNGGDSDCNYNPIEFTPSSVQTEVKRSSVQTGRFIEPFSGANSYQNPPKTVMIGYCDTYFYKPTKRQQKAKLSWLESTPTYKHLSVGGQQGNEWRCIRSSSFNNAL